MKRTTWEKINDSKPMKVWDTLGWISIAVDLVWILLGVFSKE